ncbi:radical SAM/SPASM domain-containing protein [Spirosoma sordidisoli]|uniref:SPASM domain-containing protein n=1 Tax=Spirosoma sordidisoli TaxID=2502893 RepID=A0A4Q2UDM8_9BACT|nr:radical SAM protein [Spirosoma sordidisoli]RYC66946.1 SPASM domain-containing protein [Spirosoma sordidisoli]
MEYKTSYYTLFSESVNDKGDSVLFCTRTAQALVVSKKIRELLENNEVASIDDSMLQQLLNVKAIVHYSENELVNIVDENKEAIDSSNELYEVIQPSAMCQLGCDYCGQTHVKHNINSDLYSGLIRRIRHKLSLGQEKYKSLNIGWFGGEPLMALSQIRQLTKELKNLANEFGINYGAKLVTNGLSLKENIFLELAQELSIKHIEVTLDGTETFHDSRRHTKEGGKSFRHIFNNLMKIFNRADYADSGCRISIRCNVDRRNWEDVSNLISFLSENGLNEKIAYFYLAGVYSWGGNDAHKQSLTKEEFAQKEIDWLIEMFEAGFQPSILPNRNKKVCLAVSPVSEMYDAYGNIFNCTEVSYTSHYENTEYVLGNLGKDPLRISQTRPLTNWNDTLLTDQFPCHTCKMLPVCGGGCPKSWHEDMRACPTTKFNIKDKLALAYAASKLDLRVI